MLALASAAVCVQLRFNGSLMLVLVTGVVLTWYIGSDACVNYAVTWYGNVPVTFTVCAFQVCSSQNNSSTPSLHVISCDLV